MNYIKLTNLVRRQGLRLFTPLDVQRLSGASAIATSFLLHRHAKQGRFLKLRNGLYALADDALNDLAIANRLYHPSYVSLEYALASYHLIPETTYTITSVTTRPTHLLEAAGKQFEYHHLKSSVFTGYEPMQVEGQTVLMATPEKAVLDYLYFVDLKKKTLNDRLDMTRLSRTRLASYAALFKRLSLVRLMKSLR